MSAAIMIDHAVRKSLYITYSNLWLCPRSKHRVCIRCYLAVTSCERHDLSNRRQFDYLFNCLFSLTAKKAPKIRITDPLLVESTGSPHEGSEMLKGFPCHNVITRPLLTHWSSMVVCGRYWKGGLRLQFDRISMNHCVDMTNINTFENNAWMWYYSQIVIHLSHNFVGHQNAIWSPSKSWIVLMHRQILGYSSFISVQ